MTCDLRAGEVTAVTLPHADRAEQLHLQNNHATNVAVMFTVPTCSRDHLPDSVVDGTANSSTSFEPGEDF